jgi:DNA-binding MarR family transcriptional regulator
VSNYLASRSGRPAAGPAGLRRDAADLYDVMTELLRVYQFRDRDRVGYHGLTITQCYVLDLLIQRGPLTLNQLAAGIQLDKSTLSRVVDGLERKRALKRAANPADGRSILIQATDSGTERYGRVKADIVAENEKLLADFAAGTRRKLVELIARLSQAAEARRLEPAE